MRKLLLPLLLLSVVLAGCAQQWLSQNELFTKKQECTNYKGAIQKEVDKSLIRDDDQYFSYEVKLRDVFYSPVKNSCLYGVYYIQTRKWGDWYSCGTYVIQDFLANNDVVGTYLEVEQAADGKTITCLWIKTDEVYNKALKELKWE